MRNGYRFVIIIIIILISTNIARINASAMKTGFDTDALKQDEKKQVISNINLTMFEHEPQKKTIECFDVNKNGEIALGFGKSSNKIICIYSNDGEFQRGYSFVCDGKFGVEWNNDGLMLYLVRSDIKIMINQLGEIEDVVGIQNTIDNNSYWNKVVFATSRKNGDDMYVMENNGGILNVFASSSSQLVVENSNGEKQVLYDAGSVHISNSIICFIGVLMFLAIVVWVIISQTAVSISNRTKTV